MKCTIHGTEMEYTGESPFGDDLWICDACVAAEEYEFQRTSDDDFDPLWEEAGLHADAEIEHIGDDLTPEQLDKAWRQARQAQYERLQEEIRKESEYIATLSSEQQKEYYEWDGKKPPTDEDYQVTE